MHYSAIMKFIAYLMIFIANKQNQVTARRIENEKPIGETKNFLYVNRKDCT